MSVSEESDAGFSLFEEQNFTGWLVQVRAHLRKAGAHVVLDRPRPSDLDAEGIPIPMNAQQRHTLHSTTKSQRTTGSITSLSRSS